MMQMPGQRVQYFYDLMNAAYDAAQIKDTSKQPGHVPIIEPNLRRGEIIPLESAKAR